MKIAGIITEYNPFHNGHQYHIKETRRITNADYIIAVISPDYMQRGVPALLDKHTRAKTALSQGVDLVLELPVSYACSSAEYFAMGAVSILDKLGVVDYCCFGSEYGQIEPFLAIADVLSEEPEDYKIHLKEFLKIGDSYPVARRKAFISYLNGNNDFSFPEKGFDWEQFLSSPNNILGIEYCKALHQLESPIKPVTITRAENNYHDEQLSSHISSATAIRRTLYETSDCSALESQIPSAAFAILKSSWECHGPLCEDDFSLLLKYKLMCESAETLTAYLDVSQSLANRICNNLNQFQGFSQFAELLKSKELTRTRINRALLHILLNIREMKPIMNARMLGFRKEAEPLLSAIKTSSSIPLVSKLNNEIYDPFAANLYESVLCNKYGKPFVHEYSKPVIINS